MISREEAIAWLKRISTWAYMDAQREAIDMAIESLSQPERLKGRWIQEIHTGLIGDTNEYNDTYFFRCSICGRTVFEKEPYCHCGADMRGEEE